MEANTPTTTTSSLSGSFFSIETTTAGSWGGQEQPRMLTWGRQEQPRMLTELLEAAKSGNSTPMLELVSHDRNVLLGTTLQGNTCLHISCIYGRQEFCNLVMGREECLLAAQNMDRETPLVVAVRYGHTCLASFLLRRHCSVLGLRKSVLQQDTFGFNALHHAIRNGHEDLALELIRAESGLSQAVSNCNESPVYVATLRNFTGVIEELLNIQDSSHAGPNGCKALHAAVRTGFTESAAIIMRIKPEMARVIDNDFNTPMSLAVLYNRIDVLQVLLKHDCSLGYELAEDDGCPLLVSAASRGHIGIARAVLSYCPDAPYRRLSNGRTWLHTAVSRDDAEFVEFILRTPHLGKVINMQENDGRTALHVAVINYNPRIVAALLSHEDIDVTVQNFQGNSAAWELWNNTDEANTLNWNEVCMLMAKADPQGASGLQSLHTEAKQRATKKSRTNAKSLTQTYTRNTSLVAILIAAITFAAAFTLPGGYGSAPGSEGLPIMSQKVSFKAFMISDTLAMCSSFVVAFICIIARWEDYEFLIYYRSFTKKLMWFSYVTTTTAFSTGLYTVLASHLHWLAISICVLVALLPIITWLLGKWPVLKLRIRLGKSYRSDLLDMV